MIEGHLDYTYVFAGLMGVDGMSCLYDPRTQSYVWLGSAETVTELESYASGSVFPLRNPVFQKT